MIARKLCLTAALLSVAALLTAGASPAPVTSLTATFHQPGGAPMAGAQVSVYYNDPSSVGHDEPLLASGTTNGKGQFSADLNTSALLAPDMASVGAHQVFNAVIVAAAPGQFAVRFVVLPLGQGTTVPAVTARAESGIRSAAHGSPQAPQAYVRIIKTTYRYVPVLAMNGANGIQTDLIYTYSTSTTRQTTLDAADASGINGPWSIGGSQVEQTSRDVTFPWRHWNQYHRDVFANYYWVKQAWSVGPYPPFYDWVANHFATPVTDYDPNIWKNGTTIGTINYHPPAFTSCHGNCWWIMGPDNSGFTRDSGTRATYSFELATASFISLDDWSTYGTITYQHWYYLKAGCDSPDKRVMWGDNLDPGVARIVQSDCMIPPAV